MYEPLKKTEWISFSNVTKCIRITNFLMLTILFIIILIFSIKIIYFEKEVSEIINQNNEKINNIETKLENLLDDETIDQFKNVIYKLNKILKPE
jgi:hypothetical protein